tara:strand:+ start:386 stop:946 length:561 start_codon:yes stop_codon:yes gene_type:complete
MKLLIMGPPGVGKGTQAKLIKDALNITHLSTGEILRTKIKAESQVGVIAKSFIDRGHLVPDEILINIVKDRLSKPDCTNGYLLDGFPRTLAQAEGFDKILYHEGHHLDFVISLSADESELVKRLIDRRKHSGRSDDMPEIILNRQKIYWEQTAPLLDFYRKKDILIDVNGLGKISEITNRILQKLK